MAEITDPSPPRVAAHARRLEAGEQVGPYVVLGEVGAGGMGRVYRARDTRLERLAAIKVLSSTGTSPSVLVAEAQAMAKLSHPNVVTVYDVGAVGELVYVAMELIDGQTLRAWLHAERRGWREIVDVLVRAGRGLAAAHAAGLVHRDFKPDNVLVGQNARVCVTDFGLAGAAAGTAGAVDRAADSIETLAYSGVHAGTPAYMSPEQHFGGSVDARADEFAFCVTLHEALYGERPFTGETIRELRENILTVDSHRPPADGSIPGWLRAVVRRGLLFDPAARFPSMDALLAVLERDRTVRRWRFATALAIALTLALALVRRPDAGPTCDGGGARLGRAVGPEQRDAIARAFAASGRPYWRESLAKVGAALDDYAAAWRAIHRDACEASVVRHEQSPALLDLRMQCLERRAAELGALASILSHDVDGDLVDRSISAVRALTDVRGCADAAALSAPVPPADNPAIRLAVAGLRARLDVARVDQLAGKLTQGVALALAVANEAHGLGYPPLVGEALYLAADLQDKSGDWKSLEASLDEALVAASKGRDDALAARILAKLIYVVGAHEERFVEGQALIPAATAAVLRAGDAPELRAKLDVAVAGVYQARGDLAKARDLLEQGITLEEQAGIDEVARTATLNMLGTVLKYQGRFGEARAIYERVLATYERDLGSGHPYVGAVLNNLATLARLTGDYRRAREELGRAIAIWEAAVGTEHRTVARLRSNLARVLAYEARFAEARAEYARVLAVQEKTLGPEDLDVATTLQNIGEVARGQGRFAEARRLGERELAIREKRQGRDHPDVASVHINLSASFAAERDFARARAELQAADDILARGVGGDHKLAADALHGRGLVELSAGRPNRALEAARQAAAVYAKAVGPESLEVALAHDLAGQALLALHRPADARGEHERAVEMIERASGPEHPDLASPLTHLGAALLALGRSVDARAVLERAAGLHGGGRSAEELAQTDFLLAQALWRTERERARELALHARAELAEMGRGADIERGVIDAWLRARR